MCLVTLYYYLCLTEAVRPMFVQLQQELHPGDIRCCCDETEDDIMFAYVCLAHAGASRQQ